ncbi:MAG TPA: hypothetical protein VLL76_04045 [Candidatus Omnitrophota bacterium]|nr:hypothetical protein [Candidatus Omnitrophota bacterium]
MQSFTDNAGRTWKVHLTIDAIRRVKAELAVDLLAIDQGDPPLLTRLGTDVALVVDVVFAIVRPQADEAGITDEQFGRSLGGEAIIAAHDALLEELVDFFRSLRRVHLATAIAKQQAMLQAAIVALEAKIAQADVALAAIETAAISGGQSTS